MRFIHLSDTHLGYQHLHLKERNQDFTDAFHYVIDYALQDGIDFIIHTGDFFHSSRPSNETIIEAISILRRLKDKGIPMFTIPGNHDRGSGTRDKTALDILSQFGLNVLEGGSSTISDINIFGIKHIHSVFMKKTDLKTILEELHDKAPKKDFNILMLHLEFYPFFSTDLQLESVLPDCFEYVGIGHYHQSQQPFRIRNSTVVYPGSTEYTNFNERDYSQKGFYLVEIDGKNSVKTEFIKIPTREFIIKKFDDENLEDVIDSLDSVEIGPKKRPVLILKGTTKGSLSKKDVVYMLDQKKLKDEFLHVVVDLERIQQEYEFKYLDQEEKTNSFIEEIIQEKIEDEEAKNKLRQILREINSFENLEEFENYINQHPELFEL